MTLLYFEDDIYKAKNSYYDREVLKSSGFRWNPAEKVWETNNVDSLKEACEILHDAEMDDAVRAIIDEPIPEIEPHRVEPADAPAPAGLSFREYQRQGISWIAKTSTSTILADDMGLGKTIQVCGFLNLMRDTGLTAIVVCPASLRETWRREVEKWCVDGVEPVTIVSYEGLSRGSFGHFDYAFFDEAHYLKNVKSQRTQAAFRLDAYHKIFLTGTPMLNRPVELFPLLVMCDVCDNSGKAYRQYTERFCNAHQGYYGWDVSGASNLKELRKKIHPVMLRRTRAEVLTELPELTRSIMWVDSQKSLYQQMKELGISDDQLVKFLDNLDSVQQSSVFASIRHADGLAKVPTVAQHIQDMVDDGVDRVVVFAHHRNVIDSLHHMIPNSRTIMGGMSDADRQDAVDWFQEDAAEPRVLIAGIHAAGVGLTLTRGHRIVFAEIDYTPALMDQAEARCHRIGQNNAVVSEWIVSVDSLDAEVLKMLAKKEQVIQEVMG